MKYSETKPHKANWANIFIDAHWKLCLELNSSLYERLEPNMEHMRKKSKYIPKRPTNITNILIVT
jgi:hypothetical protein